MKFFLLFILASFGIPGVSIAQDNAGNVNFCSDKTLPVEWPLRAPAQLEHGTLIFRSFSDFSEAQLAIKNTAVKPIVQFAALIELRGTQHEHLLTFAIHAVARDHYGKVPELLPTIEASEAAGFDSVIFPGDTSRIVPRSARVLTVCPTSARIEYLRVDFLGATPFLFDGGESRTDPVPREILLKGLQLPRYSRPFEQLVKVDVSQAGWASRTYVEDYPVGFLEWLDSFLERVKFIPTTFNSKPLGDSVNVLFRLHSTRKPEWGISSKSSQEKDPFVVIDVFPGKTTASPPEVFYGRRPSSAFQWGGRPSGSPVGFGASISGFAYDSIPNN